MEQLITTAIACSNKIMAKRKESMEIADTCEWLVLYIHHKNKTGVVAFRKDCLQLYDLLRHIHCYAIGHNPFK